MVLRKQQVVKSTSIKAVYQNKINIGEIHSNPYQCAAIEKLEHLESKLIRESHQIHQFKLWLNGVGLLSKSAHKRGLYLWGDVGRGKSMLMDMFMSTSPIAKPCKCRVHFYEMMQAIHTNLHKTRQALQHHKTPLKSVSKQFTAGIRLLCIDEMNITDIVDAMIVGQLFQTFFEKNLIVVTTSNNAPHDLYKHGLQREKFVPFIDLLTQHMGVHHLAGETDYRSAVSIATDGFAHKKQKPDHHFYNKPQQTTTKDDLKQIWQDLSKDTKADSLSRTFFVHKRSIILPITDQGVAWARFDSLCEQSMGFSDYLRISQSIDLLLMPNVPQMGIDNIDSSTRFAILIDILYDKGAGFLYSPLVAGDDLYKDSKNKKRLKRTLSRLLEMRIQAYRTIDVLSQSFVK